ncbi:ion transporter [Streptomyces sp. J2-1]|uniref:ion transporter n=1 Tax=Streptomyces corallincola TaxID=2851888 RepID=UPI001C388A98|nr:ion transporter [Streptomyces corallincola]MBV2354135.1 ion transporter [Streptomyces corallincola]
MPDQYTPTSSVAFRAVRRDLAHRCRDITEARWFALTVCAVIVLNAALLGTETYSGLVAAWHQWLRLAEHACLAVFTIEILLRLGAHADRPRAFFRDPWNLFDLAVVLCALLPLVRENTTILRLLRLARVLRTARFLPQLRIMLVAVARSLPGTLSFLLVGALLLYVYAMVGWVFFGHQDPRHYGSIGRAVLTLFLLMTLDGIGDAVHAGLEISRWSLAYYASYVLLASFVLVNVLIGVVITSLDEAREMERSARPDGNGPAAPPAPDAQDDRNILLARVAAARRALDDLERDLTHPPAEPPGATEVPASPTPVGSG